MTLNPGGHVLVFDYGQPQILPCRAANVVSGGQIAYLQSGTSQAVGSVLSTVAATDLLANVSASGLNFPAGVVVQNAGSNTPCGILVRGVVILPVSTNVTGGNKVVVLNGADAVDVLTSGTNTSSLLQHQSFGRALTSAASGGFALIHVNIG